MRKFGSVHIGTSGWSYNWDAFYPPGLPASERLRFFSRCFSTTEVNSTFYHMPRVNTVEKWRDDTPSAFVFALKLNRRITHLKRLRDIQDPLREFLSRAIILGFKQGPLLVQLPPRFALDVPCLRDFLEVVNDLSRELRIPFPRLALETRHPSWYASSDESNEMMALLKTYQVAFVFAHSSRYPYPRGEPITAGFVYLRFHGPKELFASKYEDGFLENTADKIKAWQREGLDVYVYFNNDVHGYAVENAMTLQEMVNPGERSLPLV